MNTLSGERFANYEDPVRVFSYSIPKKTFVDNVTVALEGLTPQMGMIEFTLFTTQWVTQKRAILLRLENGELVIAEKFGNVVGEGSSFSAHKVNTFSLSTKKHKFIIFKKTCDGQFLDEAIHKDLINEVKRQNLLAQRIHQDGKVPGVVKPYLITQAEGNKLGVFAKCFYGSLSGCCAYYDVPKAVPEMKLKLSSILCGFRYTLAALKKMHALGIYPGDIKPENILFKGIKFAISDFGDARTKEKLEETINSSMKTREKIVAISATRTPLYTNYYDLVAIQRAIRKNDIKTLILAHENCDIYAFGKTLLEVIIQKEVIWGEVVKYTIKPVKSLDDCAEYYKQIKSNLTKFHCPEKLIALVISLMEPDFRLRPSASLALESLDEIIQEKIKGDIQSLYEEAKKIESFKASLI